MSRGVLRGRNLTNTDGVTCTIKNPCISMPESKSDKEIEKNEWKKDDD